MKMNLINKFNLLFILSFLIGWGCQKQGPVELIDEGDDSKLIQVQPINNSPDSIFTHSGVDSTGIFGNENARYFAKMFFSAIRYDRPLKRDSIVQAEAIFLDKSKPVRFNGRLIAYRSFDVGVVRLGNLILNKFVHRVPLIPRRDSIIGYRYQVRSEYVYANNYRWQVTGQSGISPFEIQFNTPPEIRVLNLSPRAIRISEPLNIKWSCTNDFINIVISVESGDGLQHQLIPILYLRVRNTKGEITIPVKILEMLPIKKFTKYIFTFSSVSKSTATIIGYPDDVLIHSSSIHNISLIINS